MDCCDLLFFFFFFFFFFFVVVVVFCCCSFFFYKYHESLSLKLGKTLMFVLVFCFDVKHKRYRIYRL